MQIFKTIKVFFFCALLLLFNVLLNFALEPMDGASEVMWSEYRREENLDMIYAGASFTLRAFNPYVIDDALGTSSFNMATPAQPIDQTYVAIKTAIEEHNIKTVVLGLNYVTLETDWPVSAGVAFMRAKGKNEPLIESARDTISFLYDEDNRGECTSINFLFPWIYNHVTIDKESIANNIKAKLSEEIDSQREVTDDHMSKYIGKGFGYYVGNIDYNKVGNKNSKTTYANQFAPAAFEVVRNIAKLCEKNAVELIVINTPRPAFDVISFGEDYFVKYDRLKELFNEEDVEYYDFNLAKPEIFLAQEDYYVDYEHLNEKGATEFSEAFAEFLQLREEGRDMDAYFYSPDEYLASIDYITNCYFEAEKEQGGLLLQANAYHGSNVKVEYEISIKNLEDESYSILQEYGPQKEYLFKTDIPGEYVFCVKVRQVGTDVPYERYYEQKVYY